MKIRVAPCIAILGVLSVLTIAGQNNKTVFRSSSLTEEYTLTLDSSNCSFVPSSRGSGQSSNSNSPLTTRGNRILFAYNYAKKENGYAMNLSSSTGSLANMTSLTGLYSITVNFVGGECQLSYGQSYGNYISPLNIQSGVKYAINFANYFKIASTGSTSTNISSIVVNYACSSTDYLEPVMQHTHHGFHYIGREATTSKAGNREFYACSECQYVSLVKEDSGTYVDTVLTYDLPTNHIAYLAPLYNLHNEFLCNPPQFPYPIAANLVLPNSTYNFDNTGTSDCSSTIQQALNNLSSQGGGTVYIRTGKYRLNSQLVIPNRVTLVGDFYGPSASNYGTVFLCYKAYDSSLAYYRNSQVHLNSNTGINGITFYYPNQNINSVTEYGYTISVRSNAAASINNIFFINSYKGITINDVTDGGGELANIENVYGTCLNSGIVGYVQTDVGYWTNINISPSYYANAISEYRCADSTALYKYTRTNLTGLTLGDLDDFGLYHINVDNAKIGIYFPEDCKRSTQAFWGFLTNVNLSDCATGVLCRGTYSKGGALFTNSSLGYIVNTAQYGVLKLAKTQYDKILGEGKTIIEKGSETYEAAPSIDDTNNYNIPNYLYYIDSLDKTGATDVSTALQTEIDKIYTGGLIVLPNGTYRLDNPITIPNNTMLTSFASSYSRSAVSEGSNETVKFISYSTDACVKLGEYAGINGIRIYNANEDIDTAYNKLTNSQSDSFVAVKGIGNHSFAINTEASYTFTGFDFSSVSGHYMKYCYGAAYQTFIKAGSSGKVIASLSNWSFLSRTNLATYAVSNKTNLEKYANFESDTTKLQFVIDMLLDYATMVVINNSSNELLLNCFSYGFKCLVNTTSSTVVAVNTSIDYLRDNNYAYIVNGGDVTIINTFRVYGKSFNRISGHLKMYGRFDFTLKREAYYDSQVDTSDPYEKMPSSGLTTETLSKCENNTGVSGASRSSTRKHSGTYSWRASSTSEPAISYTFTAKDLSSIFNKAYLRFYLYCSSISGKGSNSTVELTSSGACDDQEISYDVSNQITTTGWNEIIIELSDGQKSSSTEFNRRGCNFFRFYSRYASCTYYLDDIDWLYESNASELVLNECENINNVNGASLDDFSMYGEHCWVSNSYQDTVFSFTFTSIDISSYTYLKFYFYCPDIDDLGTRVNVELTSSGTYDLNERYLNVTSQVTRNGWNEIIVPISTMKSGSPGTEFDPTGCNFFRLYTLGSNCHFLLDHIIFTN